MRRIPHLIQPMKALIRKPVLSRFNLAVLTCNNRMEVGGIILGSYRGPHIEVVDLTEPGPSDISSNFTFTRRDPVHQNSAMRAWIKSIGTVTYLGEWHTHPAGGPTPSALDLENWRAVAHQTQNAMLFVIASPLGWKPYVCHPSTPLAVPLDTIENGITGDVFAHQQL